MDVVCPGFTADCLETLEEIAQEARQAFLTAGGKEFHYLTCLNDAPEWIAAMGALVGRHLAGWLPHSAPDDQALAQSRALAMAKGAAQ